MGYRRLKELKRGYKGLLEITRDYFGNQVVTGNKGGHKGLQRVSNVECNFGL